MSLFQAINENVNSKFSFDDVKTDKYNLAVSESAGIKDLIQSYVNESRMLKAELTSAVVLSKLNSKFNIKENTVLEATKVFMEGMNEINSVFMANIRNYVSESKAGIDEMIDKVNTNDKLDTDKLIKNTYGMSCHCQAEPIKESMDTITHSLNFIMDTKFLNKGIFDKAIVENLTHRQNDDLNKYILDKINTISETVTIEGIKEMYSFEKETLVNESSFGDMITVGRVLDKILENYREQSDALEILESKLECEVMKVCEVATSILENNNFNSYAVNTFNGLNESVVLCTLEHVSNVITSVEENSSNLIKLIKE